jgi:hypothetical protein
MRFYQIELILGFIPAGTGGMGCRVGVARGAPVDISYRTCPKLYTSTCIGVYSTTIDGDMYSNFP